MLQKLLGKKWNDAIVPYLPEGYFNELGKQLGKEYRDNVVYPPIEDVFNAFIYTPYDQVNVLILGQDPYPKKGQAYGISFGTKEELAIPASLRNIDKEVENDIYDGFKLDFDFTLKHWCDQGCFMYNTALTVVEGKVGSHLKLWSPFTEAVMKALNAKEFCIFILLGKVAQNYLTFLDKREGQYIIMAPHPAAEAYSGGNSGFFGSKIFSQTNLILKDNGRDQIKW